MRLGLLIAAALAVVAVMPACRTGGDRDNSSPPTAQEQKHDPLGPNAGCYVCHTTFLREPLSRTHLKAKVGCVRCHGVSADHANDEDIGATKPDIRFRRVQVNGHCRTCHARHDVAPEAIVARWRGRRASQPTSRPAVGGIVCTDCHGQHRIAKRRS